MAKERFKNATHNTNTDSHIHLKDGDIIFLKDRYSVNQKKKLTKTQYDTKMQENEIA